MIQVFIVNFDSLHHINYKYFFQEVVAMLKSNHRTAASKQGNQKVQRNEQKVAKKTKMVENKIEQRKVISFVWFFGRVILV